jgi:hypothetical membrane protein
MTRIIKLGDEMNYYKIASLWLLMIIILAHFFAPEGYIWTFHTMSELAAQEVPNRFILLVGFYGHALLYLIGSIVLFKEKKIGRFIPILMILSSVTMFFIAFFKTTYDGLTYEAPNLLHVKYHLMAAYLNQALGFVLVGWHWYHSNSSMKRVHILFLLLSVLFSLLFIEGTLDKGIYQRLLLLTNTSYIVFFFNRLSMSVVGPIVEVNQASRN